MSNKINRYSRARLPSDNVTSLSGPITAAALLPSYGMPAATCHATSGNAIPSANFMMTSSAEPGHSQAPRGRSLSQPPPLYVPCQAPSRASSLISLPSTRENYGQNCQQFMHNRQCLLDRFPPIPSAPASVPDSDGVSYVVPVYDVSSLGHTLNSAESTSFDYADVTAVDWLIRNNSLTPGIQQLFQGATTSQDWKPVLPQYHLEQPLVKAPPWVPPCLPAPPCLSTRSSSVAESSCSDSNRCQDGTWTTRKRRASTMNPLSAEQLERKRCRNRIASRRYRARKRQQQRIRSSWIGEEDGRDEKEE